MDTAPKQTIQLLISLCIFGVMIVYVLSWGVVNRNYMKSLLNVGEKEQIVTNNTLIGKSYPVIKAKNLRIKQNDEFDVRDYVSALDGELDISDHLLFYGDVDVTTKGIYEIRCVVVNEVGLKTVQTIQVVVD